MIADRVVVEGTCYARRLRSDGELRLPGARITGNIDLAGADADAPTGDALDITGVTIGGSLLAGRHATGPDLRSPRAAGCCSPAPGSAATSCSPVPDRRRRPSPTRRGRPRRGAGRPCCPRGSSTPAACMVADRVRVEGNLELDDGLHTAGTVRLPNATVGGYLRLSGARLAGPQGASDRGIALLADGMEVGGDLEGRDNGRGALACAGQVRLVDAHVRGTASLSGVKLAAPDGYALLADRLRVGGELYLRRVRVRGHAAAAERGRRRDARLHRRPLDRPRLRPDGTHAPSLDLRAATIGKDLRVRRAGSSRPAACGRG